MRVMDKKILDLAMKLYNINKKAASYIGVYVHGNWESLDSKTVKFWYEKAEGLLKEEDNDK